MFCMFSVSLSASIAFSMIKIIALQLFYVAICLADIPVTLPVICGAIPREIYSCMGNPKVMPKPSASSKCSKSSTQCERMTCLFKEYGWMSGDVVDKAKLTAHFDDFKKQFPEWSAAVNSLKISCINADLLPQGVHLNCPAYDVMLCALSSFIKNVQPGQWSVAASCDYARQYAASCPICSNDCFAPLVPVGSCNSCSLLPRYPSDAK